MKKITTSFFLVFCSLILNSCSQVKTDSIIENADYNAQTHTLKIDYITNPDTSLLQIISFSGIRQSGYGLLLNHENSYSESELNALKFKFKKLDINAIHSYDISSLDSIKLKTKTAIEGAKFVWILDNSKNDWKSKSIGKIISNLTNTKENRFLVVLD